jgi:tetratricopeptide (TPR) repeat protein
VPDQINKSIKEHFVLIAAIIITLIVYFKFLFFGHISWDDPEMVFKNTMIKEFDLRGLFTSHFVGNYIPVTMLVHALGWFLFETHDGGHHALNIVLHVFNGILVYQLGKRLFKNELISNIGAIIFLLHPLQIESVGWISELKNVLSGTFYLAGMLSYLSYLEDKSKKNYFLCFIFFVLGCLSKSSVVILPLSLICLDMLVRQKISFRFLLNKIPFFVLSAVFGFINIKMQAADLFINHAHEFPYYQRFGLAGFALLKYLLLFLFPLHLSVIYPYPDIKMQAIVVGFAVLLLITGLIILFVRQKKINTVALILFILFNLILVLQVFPFGEVLYADRYLYIPLIGFGWILGMLVSQIKLNTVFVSFTLLLFFSVFTFARVNVWKSAIVLYEDIIKKYPAQFIALNSAGVESMFLNEDSKALEYFNKAVAIAPRNYKGFYNRGLLYLKNKKPELAIKSFNQTLELYDYTKAYTGRASAYYMLGDIPKALNDARFALQSDKNNAKAHFVAANCYNDMNRLDDAMTEYNKSIELNKNEADFYFKRAIAFGKKQDFKSCLNDLLVCLQLNPAYYEAYYWKGVAKVNLKQNPCEDFKISAQHSFEPAITAFNKYCR